MSTPREVLEAVDVDWIGVYDPQNRMTVRDRGELRELFSRAVRQAMADGVKRGVEASAKVALAYADNKFSAWSGAAVAEQIRALIGAK